MSGSGNGNDNTDPPEKPGAPGSDGMAVVRKHRQPSLEYSLRGPAANTPDASKAVRSDPAAAWGGMLQREARGGTPTAATLSPTADSATHAPTPSPPKSESGSPTRPAENSQASAPRAESASPKASASAGGAASSPPTSSGTARSGGATPGSLTPASNVAAVRSPSTAQPDELFERPEDRLNREAGRLADAHEIHESRTRFSMTSIAQIVRGVLALALFAMCGVLAVMPAAVVGDRARRQAELTVVINGIVAEIEREPSLQTALAQRDLPRLREMFMRRRSQTAERLWAAGFGNATEETVRVRLTDDGKAVGLFAEFVEPDGEVIAASGRTGARTEPKEVPSLIGLLFGEFLLPTLALTFTALLSIVGLVLWPWWRGRRAA